MLPRRWTPGLELRWLKNNPRLALCRNDERDLKEIEDEGREMRGSKNA